MLILGSLVGGLLKLFIKMKVFLVRNVFSKKICNFISLI